MTPPPKYPSTREWFVYDTLTHAHLHILSLLPHRGEVPYSVTMGNLLRVLNDKGAVPRVDFFVDFESKMFVNCLQLLLVSES